jgi:hypothetical protein
VHSNKSLFQTCGGGGVQKEEVTGAQAAGGTVAIGVSQATSYPVVVILVEPYLTLNKVVPVGPI